LEEKDYYRYITIDYITIDILL